MCHFTHFEVHTSVALILVTVLCYYHRHLFPKPFRHRNQNSVTTEQSQPQCLLRLAAGRCSFNFWLYEFTYSSCFFKSLFIFREEEGRKRGRETSMCGCLLSAPN